MSWTEITLGEVIDVKHGFAFKSKFFTTEGDYIVLTPGNCCEEGGFKSRGEKEKFYNGDIPEGYLLEENDLLVVMTDLVNSAPVLGGSFLIPESNRYLHNQRLGLVQIKDEKRIDKDFLYYLLNTRNYRGQVRGSASGATVRHTSPGRIKACKVSVPSLTEQVNISSILKQYDDLIESNRRRIQLLEESARLFYREWFIHLRFPGHEHVKVVDGVPKGWMCTEFAKVCFQYKKSVKPEDVTQDTPYIGLEHIPRRSITLSDWETAEKVESNKFEFEERDVIFGKIRPYFHKVGFTLCSGITSSDAIVMRPYDKDVYHFLLMYVSSDAFVALASQTVKEGSKMPRADWNYLLKHSVVVPHDGILKDFAEIIEPILIQLKMLATHNKKLSEARDLLLPRLMNGDIAV